MKSIITSQWSRPVLLIIMILIGWDLLIRIFKVPPYLVPTPLSVVEQLWNEWPMLVKESAPTTWATLGGFALSVLIGVPIAMLISYSKLVESFVYPLLVFSQSIPKIAVAPLFVVWFGFGIIPKIIVAFLLGVFPVVVSTVMGFKSVEQDMVDLARSMGSTRMQMFFKRRIQARSATLIN